MNHSWIRLSKNDGGPINIFCFPYSGGGAQVFSPFAEMLPPNISVYALEMPGRGRRFKEIPHKSVFSLVKEAVEGMQLIPDNSKFIFLGHSLGGLIAFETARELDHRNMPLPMHLYVSGTRAPQIPMRELTVSDLSHDEFIEKLKELGGTPDEILENKEMLEIMTPILLNDFKLYEAYRFQAYAPLECPITAFGGSKDKFVKPDDIQMWSEHTSRLFTKHIFDEGHFFIHTHSKEMIDIVMQNLTLQLRGVW